MTKAHNKSELASTRAVNDRNTETLEILIGGTEANRLINRVGRLADSDNGKEGPGKMPKGIEARTYPAE